MTAIPNQTPAPQRWIKLDGTINLTSIGAVVLLLGSWLIQYGSMSTRISVMESNQVQQAIYNAKQAEINHSLALLIDRIETKMTERQDRADFRQDRAELRSVK